MTVFHYTSVSSFPGFGLPVSSYSCLVDRKVAERSMLIKNMMDDLGDSVVETEVPIPNVSTIQLTPIWLTSDLISRAGQRVCVKKSSRVV
jgi:hypothetical protein